MELTRDDSSPVDSDISVNTLNGELEVSLRVVLCVFGYVHA